MEGNTQRAVLCLVPLIAGRDINDLFSDLNVLIFFFKCHYLRLLQVKGGINFLSYNFCTVLGQSLVAVETA